MNSNFIAGFEKRAYDYTYEAKELEKMHGRNLAAGPGSYGTGAAVGGAMGAVPGAILGAVTSTKGRALGGAVGAALGGAFGAGMGLLATLRQNVNYETAKEIKSLSPRARMERLKAEARAEEKELDRVRYNVNYNIN